MSRNTNLLWLILLSVILAGCVSKQKELEHVARDWCLTIRASQVIPIYPLTEDIQPGDIFLVQLTVNEQHKEYQKNGFLGFDNHLARLHPTGYPKFYENSFGAGGTMPKDWLDPAGGNAWEIAPDAAFPSYSFSVKKGAGFNLALPVQGVPVGLGLLGTSSAYGTINISDARTYGVDIFSLVADVDTWAEDEKVQKVLASYEPHADPKGRVDTNYIRVVSRIYLTGELNVSLTDTRSMAAGADVGVPRPVELLFPKPQSITETTTETTNEAGETVSETKRTTIDAATIEDYANQLEELNDMLRATGAPGGSLRVVSASARSISLNERFARPLVIGYLGFDMMIGEGGVLGPPIPTFSVLNNKTQPQPPRVTKQAGLFRDSAFESLYSGLEAMKADNDARAAELVAGLDRLEVLVPVQFDFSAYEPADMNAIKPTTEATAGSPIGEEGFRRVTAYMGQLDATIRTIDDGLDMARDGTAVTIVTDSDGEVLVMSLDDDSGRVLYDGMVAQLERLNRLKETVEAKLMRRPELRSAVLYLFGQSE